jgi:hypothetical protein
MTAGDIIELEPPATVDYLGKVGAEQLAELIRQYWAGLGHAGVRVWLEPVSNGAWEVRSNLARGLRSATP